MVNPLSPAEVAVCVQTEVRVRAVGRYLSQTAGAERVLQCLAVFRTGFGLSRFPALCALIPYSKPDGFLLANILSLETLPCREVHSCWDEFRATARRSAMAHRSLSPDAVFIISLVFGGPWLCPIFHSSGDWKVIPSKLLVLETQDHFLPFSPHFLFSPCSTPQLVLLPLSRCALGGNIILFAGFVKDLFGVQIYSQVIFLVFSFRGCEVCLFVLSTGRLYQIPLPSEERRHSKVAACGGYRKIDCL